MTVRTIDEINAAIEGANALAVAGDIYDADVEYLEIVADVLSWVIGDLDHPLGDYL